MNVWQKTAFGAFAVMVVAWLAAKVGGLGMLGMISIAALVVALLTLATTWRILFWILQVASTLIAGAFHLVGFGADRVTSWSQNSRQRLSTGNHDIIPEWSEVVVVSGDDNLMNPAESGFIESAFDRQNS